MRTVSTYQTAFPETPSTRPARISTPRTVLWAGLSLLLSICLCAVSCSAVRESSTPRVTKEFIYTESDFPSCHAATITEYPEGQLTVAFFGGEKERANDVCIWLSRKSLSDTTWSPLENVAGDKTVACWNPVLYTCEDGRMLLFYKSGKSVPQWTGHVKTSYDGGRTWPEEESFPSGMVGAVKNKPVRLPSGRIISPSSIEVKLAEGETGPAWTCHFEISDDDGRTWRKVGPVASADSIDVIQPSIILHRDGTIEALMRSRNSRVASTISRDNGETWSEIELTDFPNNNSGIDAVTLPDGRFAMVCNPVASRKGERYPLSVFVSEDARHWEELVTLETEPCKAGYCYPSMIVGSDGALHVVYTWDRRRIRYARIELQLPHRRMEMGKTLSLRSETAWRMRHGKHATVQHSRL